MQRERFRARMTAALRPARERAYREGQFVGQESFMTADEILALAGAAGVAAGTTVIDLCCGRGGPALFLARATGCNVVGADSSPEAIELARATAERSGLTERASFVVADATRVPFTTTFDAALLLETLLSIEDKPAVLREARRLLRPGGRFGLTAEEGRPLTPEERRLMPEGNMVWLVTEDELLALLDESGFRARLVEDHTAAHADVARRLAVAVGEDRAAIASQLGAEATEQILAQHAHWARWLSAGRVRKLALVAEATASVSS